MASNTTALREPLSNRFTPRLYTVSRSRVKAGAPGEEAPSARRAPVVMAGCIQDHE